MMHIMRDTKKTTWLLRTTLAAGLVLGLAACGGDDDDASDESEQPADDGDGTSAAAVTIEDFAFDAQTVGAGETFSVENLDSAGHTFTADGGEFDEPVGAGETAEVTAPDAAGTYPFHCEIHTTMTGELVVE